MHRWQKAGRHYWYNVLNSTFKFKCINYTNTGGDEPGKGETNYPNTNLFILAQAKNILYNKSLSLTLPATEDPSDRMQ